ncbi:MAG: LPS assembly protein LptD [Phycisphaeraceae bacterium]|nr:LPS assembly protein LptD [Phycisphaeraceae bacterium]
MPPRSRLITTFARSMPLFVGLAVGLEMGVVALAQPIDAAVPPQADGSRITGRSFAGIRLPLAAVSGPVEFRGQRIWTWSEPSESAGFGEAGLGPVTRVLLKGDVRVVLGTYEFDAKGAAVWIQKLRPDSVTPEGTYQVYVYFDHVRTPAADAVFAVSADRLPVRGVITTDAVSLKGDRIDRSRPSDLLIAEGESTLREQLVAIVSPPRPIPPPLRRPAREGDVVDGPAERLAGGDDALLPPPGGREPVEPDPSRGQEPSGVPAPRSRVLPPARQVAEIPPSDIGPVVEAVDALGPGERSEAIAPGKGLITFSTGRAGDVSIVTSEEENVVVFSSPLVVQYTDRAGGRSIQISADRGVAFLKPGPLTQLATVDADTVRGVYLEGGVQVIGERPSGRGSDRYMFRGPSMFYDFQADRAITLDAMFWTYDSERSLPLYVRAKALKQESANQWSAQSAKAANTAFLNPQLSLGTSSITISRRETPTGSETYADARNITGNIGFMPVFWFPRYRGDPSSIPIREVALDGSSGSGGAIKTTWDAYALLGLERTSGVDAEIALDYYFERGPAIGSTIDWDTPSTQGSMFGYLVAMDMGRDTLKGGAKKDFDEETRGMLLIEHRWEINDQWSVLLDGAFISDETFIDGYFESMGETRREFASSATARRLGENSLLTIQAKGNINDFIANEYLTQSQGYNVSKLPEATYVRVADDLLPNIAPGLLSYHSEYRLGRMSMRFSESTGRDLGYSTVAKSQRAFGFGPDASFADTLEDAGYTEDAVMRLDSRHEIDTRLRFGAINVQPFMVGRVTAYDDSFDEFSPGNDDETRLWGSVGARASTSFQRVNNRIDSAFFDIHRVRHIVEPKVTFWTAGTNTEASNLPVYDGTVEDLANGTAMRLGLDQTWQTQRGGAGRWHTVDFLTLDVEYATFSDDADRKSPILRFIDYRPEYSQPGEFFQIDATWQVTSAVGIGGNMIYDLELNQPARESAGVTLQHNPDLTSYVEMRYINVEDTTFVNAGAIARVTQKYMMGINVAYDTERGDFQTTSFTVYREMQSLILQGRIGYNNITGETSGGINIFPVGTKGRGLPVQAVGATDVRYLERETVVR